MPAVERSEVVLEENRHSLLRLLLVCESHSRLAWIYQDCGVRKEEVGGDKLVSFQEASAGCSE